TITQQVVKTLLLTSEKKISRKVKEVILARRLEQKLSKEQILYLYLNQIYFGHRRNGIEEAARFYFGKGVQPLSLGEAAVIAGAGLCKRAPDPFPAALPPAGCKGPPAGGARDPPKALERGQAIKALLAG